MKSSDNISIIGGATGLANPKPSDAKSLLAPLTAWFHVWTVPRMQEEK
jgi:hypothetical protein